VTSNIDSKLQELSVQYAKKLPAKIDTIQKYWLKLKSDWNDSAWDDLYREVHNLTGSAGTYGYHQLSKDARTLVELLKKHKEKVPNENQFDDIDDIIAKLSKFTKDQELSLTKTQPLKSHDKRIHQKSRLIYFLVKNVSDKNEIEKLLSNYNCKIEIFEDSDSLFKKLQKKIPTVIILDISSLNSSDKTIFQNNIQDYDFIPIIAISEKNTLESQLEAVRLGSRSYFTKPLDFTLLCEKLNQILNTFADPYRILIVEDSVNLADYFSTILEQAGMKTSVVTNPLNIDQALVSFKPELILTDLYMPKISGLELAALLRLQPTYESIPIVFLSSEEDKTKQLEAMSLGGDDFITKPVSPEYLIWSVRNRAERYRGLRNLVLKDSLTGLYNFTSLLNQLESNLLRAKRNSEPLSFVMLDLDNFKRVNDTHGHIVGNQVLKSFALLLQQRLRHSDIISRYGGEEFALLLPNTSVETALKLCTDLQELFAKERHNIAQCSFTVTFSAGIASCPPYTSSKDIILAADKRLYRAKEAGRNCIIIQD
jgi:diguanylate cyclase (GGDEF)-like protein